MAWQNPKIDWSSEDGVRDSDFNRIEGNILELYNTTGKYVDTTVYVSAAGDDSAGNGTASSPYRTINKALSTLPRNLNGKNVAINIGSGTYAEAVVLKGFTGGSLLITGAAASNATFNSLTIDGCTVVVSVLGITTTTSPGIVLQNGAIFATSGIISVSGGSTGISALGCSQAHFGSSVSVSGATTAVSVSNNSRVFIFQLTASSVGTGMIASNGGIIAYGSFSGNVNSAITVTSTGGRTYTGTGTSGGINPGI